MAFFESQGPEPNPPGGGGPVKPDRKIPPAEPPPEPKS